MRVRDGGSRPRGRGQHKPPDAGEEPDWDGQGRGPLPDPEMRSSGQPRRCLCPPATATKYSPREGHRRGLLPASQGPQETQGARGDLWGQPPPVRRQETGHLEFQGLRQADPPPHGPWSKIDHQRPRLSIPASHPDTTTATPTRTPLPATTPLSDPVIPGPSVLAKGKGMTGRRGNSAGTHAWSWSSGRPLKLLSL